MLTQSRTSLLRLVSKHQKLSIFSPALSYSFSNDNHKHKESFQEKLDKMKNHDHDHHNHDYFKWPKATTDARTHHDTTPTSEDLLKSDYGLATYMLRVYRTTGLSIGSYMAGGYMLSQTALPFLHPFGMVLGGFAISIGGILGFNSIPQIPGSFTLPDGKKVPSLENPLSRKLCFAAIIGGNTLALAPLITMLNAMSPTIVPASIALSLLVMGGSSLYSLRAKHGSFSGWTAGLYGGLLGVIGLNVVSALTYMMIGPNIFSFMCRRVDTYFGIGLFTAFQIFDTQKAIEEYREGRYDHLSHAINFYLNFVNIFVRLAEIIRSWYEE